MNFWVIADTHLGHDEMVEYESRHPDFSNRILHTLSKNLRSKDILIHLGDICIGDEANWHQKLAAATSQCYRRWLVLGNHDKRTHSWYLGHGWDMVCTALTLEKFGAYIVFTHKPIPQYLGCMHDKYATENGLTFINMHGHIHYNNRYNYNVQDYHYLLSCNTPCIPKTLKTLVRQALSERGGNNDSN